MPYPPEEQENPRPFDQETARCPDAVAEQIEHQHAKAHALAEIGAEAFGKTCAVVQTTPQKLRQIARDLEEKQAFCSPRVLVETEDSAVILVADEEELIRHAQGKASDWV